MINKATIHAKTATNKSILTQRDELQRLVDARELDNSQAVFIACSNDVCKYLFQINGKPISEYVQCVEASFIGFISNKSDDGH